ncbi:MAG TPA: hypothetical protein DCE42_22665 [Myxococcales bacterium]|nr:hypothetical protein [Deltaproteobacteria bacterium]HAA57587.1 hypothetical protein [Myxococcales bacterium]
MRYSFLLIMCIAGPLLGCQQDPEQQRVALILKIEQMENKFATFNKDLKQTRLAQKALTKKIALSEREIDKAKSKNALLIQKQKNTQTLLRKLEIQRMTAQKLYRVIKSEANFEKCRASLTLVYSNREKQRAKFFLDVANHMVCRAKKAKRRGKGAVAGAVFAILTGGSSLILSAAGAALGSLGKKCDTKPNRYVMEAAMRAFDLRINTIRPNCNQLKTTFEAIRDEYRKQKSEEENEFLKACQKGETKECHRIGKKYAAGLDIAQSYEKAGEFFKKACVRGHGESCSELGWLYHTGQGTNRNYRRARQLYRKSCNLGYGTGCSNLGYLYYRGKGGRRSKTKARELYKQACDLKSGAGCNQLGNMYLKGRGVRRNAKTASRYYSRSCTLGYRFGCYNVAYLYKYGKGLTKNCALASQFFRKACLLGSNSACKNRCR